MSIIISFMASWFWVAKVILVILFFTSLLMMWKINEIDYKKSIGVPLGKPFKPTKENKDIAKKLANKSDMWGFIAIICTIIMIVDYIMESFKSLFIFIFK